MNKTENINIGGLIFYIDESAYAILSGYFSAIKRSLTDSKGQDEIMRDIEMRVAELLAERQKSDKHVIDKNDVDEVIRIMGKPEDYRIDMDEDEPAEQPESASNRRVRKLYRDVDKGMLGGVCTGLGHFFGIDVVWLRILFLVLIFGGGSGIILYLILWIATPGAMTTAEKLEMTGEPVNISNIERKVREEFEQVSEKMKNMDYDKVGHQFKGGARRIGQGFSEIFLNIIHMFGKVLGGITLFFSSLMLIAICVAAIIMILSSSLPQIEAVQFIHTPIGLETPFWLQGLLLLFTAGIPLFAFFILGLKMLNPQRRYMGNTVRFSLLAIWVVSLGISVYFMAREATQMAFEGKDIRKEKLTLTPGDTLRIGFRFNDYFAKNVDEIEDYRITQDSLHHDIIYSNNVALHLMKTDRAQAYVQMERWAQGKSFKEANERAEKIQYGYVFNGKTLLLNNYFTTPMSSKFRDQHIDVYVYLPENTYFKMDSSTQNFDQSDNNFFNLHYSSDDYIYRVRTDQVKCTNCPENENEYFDVEIEEPSLPEVPSAPEAPTTAQGSRYFRDAQGVLHKK